MSAGAAGLDLASAADEPIEIPPGGRVAVPTGLAFEIPPGFEGQVRPRSGLARKFGITLPNAPGTIDSDYRGEVQVLLANLGAEAYVVQPGDRVAQLVIAPVVDRGAGGGRRRWTTAPAATAASATPAGDRFEAEDMVSGLSLALPGLAYE